jgi:hypothetical protein
MRSRLQGAAVVGRAIRSEWWGVPLTALEISKNRVPGFFFGFGILATQVERRSFFVCFSLNVEIERDHHAGSCVAFLLTVIVLQCHRCRLILSTLLILVKWLPHP